MVLVNRKRISRTQQLALQSGNPHCLGHDTHSLLTGNLLFRTEGSILITRDQLIIKSGLDNLRVPVLLGYVGERSRLVCIQPQSETLHQNRGKLGPCNIPFRLEAIRANALNHHPGAHIINGALAPMTGCIRKLQRVIHNGIGAVG
ncbi:hypothetical protein D3C76_1326110 [compost metagenome]